MMEVYMHSEKNRIKKRREIGKKSNDKKKTSKKKKKEPNHLDDSFPFPL